MRFGLLLLLLFTSMANAGSLQVNGVRLWAAPDSTRVVLDVTGPVEHKLFTLKGPDRLVVDLKDATVSKELVNQLKSSGVVKGLRSGSRNKGDLRLVLDLSSPVKPKSFVLKPNDQYGHRLVIDLFGTGKAKKSEPKTVKAVSEPASLRDLVIAVDAGHGGEDPGARGRKGHQDDGGGNRSPGGSTLSDCDLGSRRLQQDDHSGLGKHLVSQRLNEFRLLLLLQGLYDLLTGLGVILSQPIPVGRHDLDDLALVGLGHLFVHVRAPGTLLG